MLFIYKSKTLQLALQAELGNPSDKIVNTFSESTINGFRVTAAVLSGFLFLWVVGFAAYQLKTRSCGFQKPAADDEEEGNKEIA